jgi:hypothetical protein
LGQIVDLDELFLGSEMQLWAICLAKEGEKMSPFNSPSSTAITLLAKINAQVGRFFCFAHSRVFQTLPLLSFPRLVKLIIAFLLRKKNR